MARCHSSVIPMFFCLFPHRRKECGLKKTKGNISGSKSNHPYLALRETNKDTNIWIPYAIFSLLCPMLTFVRHSKSEKCEVCQQSIKSLKKLLYNQNNKPTKAR